VTESCDRQAWLAPSPLRGLAAEVPRLPMGERYGGVRSTAVASPQSTAYNVAEEVSTLVEAVA
jgi:hypothetical protein